MWLNGHDSFWILISLLILVIITICRSEEQVRRRVAKEKEQLLEQFHQRLLAKRQKFEAQKKKRLEELDKEEAEISKKLNELTTLDGEVLDVKGTYQGSPISCLSEDKMHQKFFYHDFKKWMISYALFVLVCSWATAKSGYSGTWFHNSKQCHWSRTATKGANKFILYDLSIALERGSTIAGLWLYCNCLYMYDVVS